MLYPLFKKFLFTLDPEKAHHLALTSLNLAYRCGLSKLFPSTPHQPRTVMGLPFPNPIGLAAGFDKNGDYIDALASLGFGFIEVGTITPKPQAGNPRPRLFRLSEQQAIINRMGFNNKGVDHLVKQLQKTKFKGILGINIGKNKDTPLENAVDDYLYSFNRLAEFASYVTVNISSPNTADLRNLQHGDLLKNLLHTLKLEQARYFQEKNKYVPLVVKIAPDLNEEELNSLAASLLSERIDAVIATNTTISRDGIQDLPVAAEAGGLSGKPLGPRSTAILRQLHEKLQGQIPIIASGGVMTAEDVREKIAAGAVLVQVYSGFIYETPWIAGVLLNSLS